MKDGSKFLDQAAAKKPTVLGWVFVACVAALCVMGTVKIGLILFT